MGLLAAPMEPAADGLSTGSMHMEQKATEETEGITVVLQ